MNGVLRMKKITVETNFWELFPEAQINVLIVKGIHNQNTEEEQDYFIKLLKNGKKEAQKFLTEEIFSHNSVVDEWRKAFGLFKTKKGARSSIEALLKRVSQDREFSPINPLVDIYNSVSLTYGLPCGGEDWHAIQGDLHLGKAQGGESFRPLGSEEDSPALPEEIIYYDNEGAICRCLNWREAQRTMLAENTTDAILVIESINQTQAQQADKAIRVLKKLVDDYFKIESSISTLTKANASVSIE